MRLLILAVLLFTLPATAGVVIHKEITLKEGKTTQKLKSVYYFEGNLMRLELGSGKDKSITLVNGDKKTVSNIHPGEENYFEVPLEDIRVQMKKNIELAINGLKEEQRQPKVKAQRKVEIERALAQLSSSRFVFRKQKADIKKGKWRCDLYDAFANAKGPKIGQICTSPMEKLNLKQSDFVAMESFGTYLMRSFGGLVSGVETYTKHGYPVWTKAKGQFEMELLTTKIERKKLEASLFLPPKKYRNVGPVSVTPKSKK